MLRPMSESETKKEPLDPRGRRVEVQTTVLASDNPWASSTPSEWMNSCTYFNPRRKEFRKCENIRAIHFTFQDDWKSESRDSVAALRNLMWRGDRIVKSVEHKWINAAVSFGFEETSDLFHENSETVFWLQCNKCLRKVFVNLTRWEGVYHRAPYMVGFRDECFDTFSFQQPKTRSLKRYKASMWGI